MPLKTDTKKSNHLEPKFSPKMEVNICSKKVQVILHPPTQEKEIERRRNNRN